VSDPPDKPGPDSPEPPAAPARPTITQPLAPVEPGTEAEGPFVVEFKRPGKFHMQLEMLGKKVFRNFDGKAAGWTLNPFAGDAEPRAMTPEEVKDIVDKGPYDAPQALKAGLVDELLYQDQVEEKLSGASRVSPSRYLRGSRGFGLDNRNGHYLGAIGRLRPGVTLAAARADLAAVAEALGREHGDSDRGYGADLLPARRPALRRDLRPARRRRGRAPPAAVRAAGRRTCSAASRSCRSGTHGTSRSRRRPRSRRSARWRCSSDDS